MNENIKKLNPLGRIAKCIGSDLPLSLLLISNKGTLPDSAISFLSGIALLPANVNFSLNSLKTWFKNNHFEKTFKPVTIKGKTYKVAFDFYFEAFQSNFFSKKPIISKINNNLFIANKILPNLKLLTPHKSVYKVMINTNIIQTYKGDMNKLYKSLSFELLRGLSEKCKKTLFTNNQIENIFGLSKKEINSHLKAVRGYKEFVYRTIGCNESRELGQTNSIHTKYKRQQVIKGFTIKVNPRTRHTNILSINYKSLATIKDRLEKHQRHFSQTEFYEVVSRKNNPELMSQKWQFNEQYELLGFTGITSSNKAQAMGKYIDIRNFGQFKQKKNIYTYLKKYFDGDKKFFKKTLHKLISLHTI